MSLIDKVQFLKTVIPNLIDILRVIIKCLECIVGATADVK